MPKPIYISPTVISAAELRFDLSQRFFFLETPEKLAIGFRDEHGITIESIPARYAPLMRRFGKKLDELGRMGQ